MPVSRPLSKPFSLFRSEPVFRLTVTVIMLAFTALLSRFPAHNGDLPFYIAAAFNLQGMSDNEALAASAAEIRTALPAVEAEDHLANLQRAPENFLDFYRIKTGYTHSIVLLHRAGFPYLTATVIPSLIAFFFLGLGVFMWGRNISRSAFLIPGCALLLFFTAAFQPGRMSTPDAPAQCLLFWSLYRVRFGKSAALTVGFLLLSLFFRIDNLPAIAGTLLLMYRFPFPNAARAPGLDAFPGRLSGRGFCFSVLAAAGCCVGINAWSEPRFWWFRPVPYPGVINLPDPAPLVHFILNLARGPLPVLLALTAIVFSGITRYRKKASGEKTAMPAEPGLSGPQTNALLVFLAAMFPVRFLLFPHYEARFFVAFYLAGFCVLIGELVSSRKEQVPGGRASG